MKNAISLFCSSGIGDLGLQANGFERLSQTNYYQNAQDYFKQIIQIARCFQEISGS